MISSLVCNQPAVEGVVQRRGRRQARSTQSRETLFLSFESVAVFTDYARTRFTFS